MGNPRQRIGAISGIKNRLREDLPHSDRMIAIATRLDEFARALIDVHEHPSSTITEAAHFMKVQEAAAKLEKQRQKALADVNTIMRDSVGEAQKRLDQKVKLVPGPNAAEIRTVFRGLNKPDQIVFLNQLARDNKGPELAAIVEVGSEYTGFMLSDDERKRARDLILRTHAEGELNDIEAMNETLKSLFLIMDVVRDLANDFADPYKLASIRRGEELAATLEAKLNASLAD